MGVLDSTYKISTRDFCRIDITIPTWSCVAIESRTGRLCNAQEIVDKIFNTLDKDLHESLRHINPLNFYTIPQNESDEWATRITGFLKMKSPDGTPVTCRVEPEVVDEAVYKIRISSQSAIYLMTIYIYPFTHIDWYGIK